MKSTYGLALNDFAIRCFRDIADADYIVARMACRIALVTQYLWASQQAVEKYLKCILLLNRIPAGQVRHDLGAALSKINNSGKLAVNLTDATKRFIEYLDTFGRFRYLEVSHFAFGKDLVTLDRATWELRRYCTSLDFPRQATLRSGFPPPLVRIPGGYLEKIIDDLKNHAWQPLLWQNAFFGKRVRKKVKLTSWLKAVNSPLSFHSDLLDEIMKYVHIPKEVADAYRSHEKRSMGSISTKPRPS